MFFPHNRNLYNLRNVDITMGEICLDYDIEFENEVSVNNAGKGTLYRLTIRKQKAQQLGLLGGEYVRVFLEKDGKMTVFEKQVQLVKSPTGKYIRVTIPKENAEYLNINGNDNTVKAYIKLLQR